MKTKNIVLLIVVFFMVLVLPLAGRLPALIVLLWKVIRLLRRSDVFTAGP